jgi:RND family efflux transporter MFP subunit
MRKVRPPVVIAAIAALLVGTGLAAMPERLSAADAKPTESLARAVVVQAVHFAPRIEPRTLVGTIRPRTESDLGFRIPGKIVARLVQQGDRVVAGQPLARLDPTDVDLQLEQARAEWTAAQQALATSEAQDRRTIELRKNGWTTDAILDRQLAATAEARSRVERARRAVDLVENQVGYTTLIAEADGIITATPAEVGQVVAAGIPVVRMARAGEHEAVVAVPEVMMERARASLASVSLWSNPNVSYPATLREMAAAADPATRTFQARFALQKSDPAVGIGMTATVTLTAPDPAPVARLPVSALFAEGAGPAMFVINSAAGTAELRPVTLAGYDGRDVLVSTGLANGDLVVALGVHKLDPGQKVRIVETRR